MKKEIEKSNQEQAVDLLNNICKMVNKALEQDGIWPATTSTLEIIRSEAKQGIEYATLPAPSKF